MEICLKAKRVDANQPKIVEAFRKLGFKVAHTHTIGKGFPDIVVSRRGKTKLIEIKDGAQPPSKRKLTPDEEKFHQEWDDHIPIIETEEDVVSFAKSF